jgi:signal transduction histidine kinase
MENGELRIQQSSFPIAELLQLNAQNMADAAREASCDIRVEARFDLPNVWADRDLINQVIANLLSNALKHTRHGSNVLLSADSDHEGHVIVYVHDQGEGISAEDQTRIFEKFARTRRGGSPDGTGLGLAFCKQAIELHSGRIWVESTVGRGSTFAFSLPTLTTVAAI